MDQCEICYLEITDQQDKAFCDSCGEDFHVDCVQQTISRANNCPMCRQAFVDPIDPARQPYSTVPLRRLRWAVTIFALFGVIGAVAVVNGYGNGDDATLTYGWVIMLSCWGLMVASFRALRRQEESATDLIRERIMINRKKKTDQ